MVQGSQDESTLGKLRGTYAYSAPEVYKGEKYSGKADVFSLGVILWEGVARILTGEYQRPYKEFNYRIDFQIIINSAKHGVRPKLGLDIAPANLRSLITRCWNPLPGERPETQEVLDQLLEVRREYESNRAEWDALVNALEGQDGTNKPAAPAPVKPAVVATPVAKPAPVEPAVTSEAGTKWAHKTLEELFPDGMPTDEDPTLRNSGSTVDKKGRRASLGRNQSNKKLISKKEDPSDSAPAGTLEIEVTGTWKSTVDWREEDAFDEDKKKSKWGSGLKKFLGKDKKKK